MMVGRTLAIAAALGVALLPGMASASTGWALQPLSSEYDGSSVNSMLESVSCVSGSSCMAVGVNQARIAPYFSLAEYWNGSTWQPQSMPYPADSGGDWSNIDLRGVKCISTFCMAVGQYVNTSGAGKTLGENWNGSSWSLQSTVNPTGASSSQLNSVACTTTANCTAVGYYKNSSGTNLPLAEHWDGSTWALQSLPATTGGHLLEVSCTSASACTAVGYAGSSGLADRWNGSTWKTQAVPKPSGASKLSLKSVKCVSSSVCMAVGATGNLAGNSPSGTLVSERWNGTAWKVQTIKAPSAATASELNGISCTSTTSCYAVGDDYQPTYAETYTLAEYWNGTSWTIQSTPNPYIGGNFLLSVSCVSSTACEATGDYFSDNSQAAFAIQRT